MSIGRRRELLAWAAKNRCWIIEDDYDSEFRYGLKPTQTLHSCGRRLQHAEFQPVSKCLVISGQINSNSRHPRII
jgi:DNA-binding transcriptional MocR family regulator